MYEVRFQNLNQQLSSEADKDPDYTQFLLWIIWQCSSPYTNKMTETNHTATRTYLHTNYSSQRDFKTTHAVDIGE